MHLVFEMLAAVGVTVHLDGLDGFTDIIWQLSRVQQGPVVPVDPRSEQLADTGSTDARGGQAHLVNVHFDLGKMGLGQPGDHGDQTAQLGDEVKGCKLGMELVFETLATIRVTHDLDAGDGFADVRRGLD